MLSFEPVTEPLLAVIREIVHSNTAYNVLENGRGTRTDEELRQEFLHGDAARRTCFVKADDTYIGLLDYMEHHERDGCPWLGLLMIHHDYQGYGYGTNAYYMLEQELRQCGHTVLRLGVLPENQRAAAFWEGLGFVKYEQKYSTTGILVDCLEKQLA